MPRKVFYLLAFVMFLTNTGYGVVLPSLPYLADRIGLNSFQMGSLITGWAVAQFIATPIWGRLVDKIGRKPIFLFGLFGFSIAFYLLLFVQNYWQLLFARVIGATLSSGTQPAIFAMVADLTDKKERGKWMGKMGAFNGLGFLCGPGVGGLLSPLGLEAPFIAAGSFALVALPFAFLFLREPEQKSEQERRPSFWGSFSVLWKPGYRELFAATFGMSLAASALFGMLGYFMMARFDATQLETSMGFSMQSGTSVFVQFILLGWLYDRFGEEKIAKSGLFFAAIGYAVIALSFGIWVALVGCALVGLGNAMLRPTITSLLSNRQTIGQGMTMGLQGSVDSFGRIVGPLWGGLVFELHPAGPFFTSSAIILLLLIMMMITVRQGTGAWGESEPEKARA